MMMVVRGSWRIVSTPIRVNVAKASIAGKHIRYTLFD
jgi:hypothetical protein